MYKFPCLYEVDNKRFSNEDAEYIVRGVVDFYVDLEKEHLADVDELKSEYKKKTALLPWVFKIIQK